MIHYLFKLFLLIILLVIIINKNVVFCGDTTGPTSTTTLQETVTDFVLNHMNADQLDAFNRHIGLRLPEGWEAADYFHNNVVEPSQTFNYTGFFIWLAASTALFIFSRWHTEIIEFLFSLPRRTVEILPDIYNGLTESMRALGREAAFRQYVANSAVEMLNNPETASRVQGAIEIYLQSRGLAA